MTLLTHEVEAAARALGPWYHSVKLTPNYTTAGEMEKGCADLWRHIRKVREGIDYKGKSVLDLGSLDGMWSFEAEACGASTVIAGDILQMAGQATYERFSFARFVRDSKVCFLPNVDIHDLPNRLDSVLRAWEIGAGFDIIQCFGLLYHVQNPLLALQQMRRVIKDGGSLFLETACRDEPGSNMRFNYDRSFYDDPVTYWIPTKMCLMEMLALSGFELLHLSFGRAERICIVAGAVEFIDREKALG
jgi:tRNA (mo5U34)-methyltransferase